MKTTWLQRPCARLTALVGLLLSSALSGAAADTVFTGDTTYVVPNGVSQLRVSVAGGGGGGGGPDSATFDSRGGYAGDGAKLLGTLAVTPGERLTFRIGAGGAGGAEGHCTGGGNGGSGWTAGGRGGNSGCYNVSGAGGGGGGSSAILRGTTVLVVAGGGGGGNGASRNNAGLPGMSSGDAVWFGQPQQVPGGPGDGGYQNSDGGGGGGAGGGCTAAIGGSAHADFKPDSRAAQAGLSCTPGAVRYFTSTPQGGVGGPGGLANEVPGRAGQSGRITVHAPLVSFSMSGPQRSRQGIPLTYGFTLLDIGGFAPGAQIVVRDQLPAGTSATAVAPVDGFSSVSCGPLPSPPGALLVCTLTVASARSGNNGGFSITVDPGANAAGSSLRNHASMNTDGAALPATTPGPGCESDNAVSCAVLDTLIELPAIAPILAFMPNVVLPGQASELSITLASPVGSGASTTLNSLAFSDDYPAGLVNASPPQVSATGCGAAAVSAVAGAASLALKGGSLAPGARCVVKVRVMAAAVGSYTNILPAGSVASTNPTASAAASTVLVVRARPKLRLQKHITGGIGGSFTFSFSQTNLDSTPAAITVLSAQVAVPASPAAIEVTTSGAAVTVTESPQAGFLPTAASCTDLNAAMTGNPARFGSLVDSTLTVSAAQVVPGADMLCVITSDYRATVSGRVFDDTGRTGGVANDGIANGGEPGVTGILLVLTDCAATRHAQARSDEAGHFALAVPGSVTTGAPLCVEAGRPASRQSTGASVAATVLTPGVATALGGTRYLYSRDNLSDRVSFSWPGLPIGTINFGSVSRGSLAQAGLGNGRAGSTVQYAHTFTAGTAGQVGFSVRGPATDGWTERVVEDVGCTGSVQPGAAQLYPPAVALPVQAGQVVCVVVQQAIPIQAPAGTRRTARVEARLDFANAPALSATYAVDDLTTVTGEVLKLSKEVRNMSQGAAAFGVRNSARSGDTLEYRIGYANLSPAPIADLRIVDVIPAFTRYVGATVGSTPASLTACSHTSPVHTEPVDCALANGTAIGGRMIANDGKSGSASVVWTFAGGLAPGASGSVLYRVLVD